MRPGCYLVMRYGPMIGRPVNSRRRVALLTRSPTLLGAVSYAKGWLEVERRHSGRSVVWVAKQGAPATAHVRQ
jgi:hypothetical protein